ncbi:MAG: putative ATPase [bacterium F082]|nr:MAG: putative ATPase [bacterium F082]KWW30539.1 MAG: putative ATPase [bacterium P201]
MKFYDRNAELQILEKNWQQSVNHSMMTTLTGRRRIGKTALLLKSAENKACLYLYVSKDNEQVLCRKFQQQAQNVLDLQLYGQVENFGNLFKELMKYGENHHYTLIIDEFQNLLGINAAIPSEIQDIWDRNKDKTQVNLVLCGSIYSMMKRIFDHSDQPLYGRRDSHLRLLPFSIETLKNILADHNPDYNPDDLLCLYMLTGGVAKYVALLMDARATTKQKMLNFALSPDSPFLTEGTELLISEFGRDYGTYFSILQLIASGMTTQNEIDSIIGKNTGAYLNNMHEDYLFISKNTPLLSKPGVRNIRWQIDDCFLRFWFRFVYPYQGLIESNQLGLLKQYVTDNYAQFTGRTLERYFQEKAMQGGKFTKVGNWWDRKGKNEIDMVALNEFDKTCLVAEIKRNKDRISMKDLQEKAGVLPSEFSAYQIQMKGLSLEDM